MQFRPIVRHIAAVGFALLVSTAAFAQPAIIDFIPKTGVAGSPVTIFGTNLGFVISITFNGMPASFVLIDYQTIIATVPRFVTTGKISGLSNIGTTTTSAVNFTVPAPVISSFSPHQLAANTSVVITGSSFTDTTVVTFNGVSAAGFAVASDTSIVAIVPAASTDGRVGVTTFGGGNTLSPGSFTRVPGLISNPLFDTDVAGWLIDRTGWVIPLDSLTSDWSTSDADNRPSSGAMLLTNRSDHIAMAAEQCVPVTALTRYTLGGRFFVANGQPETGIARVEIGWNAGANCNTGLVTPAFSDFLVGRHIGSWTTLVANGMAPVGTHSATIIINVWPDAGGTANIWSALFDNLFFDVERAPSIAAFSPSIGLPGAVVTLTGNDFYGASAVRFNGVTATTFEVKSATTLVATIPPTATTGPISVIGPGGTGSTATAFRVIGIPTITSVSPASGYPGAFITIGGTDLDTATSVRFNGVIASTLLYFYPGFAPYIVATVPAGATTGPLTVTNVRGTASSPFRVLHAAGDLNGDQKADIVLQNTTTRDVAVWQMNGTAIAAGFVVGTPAASYFVKTVSDIDGDGKADITLQDAATGDVVFWRMNGGTILSGVIVARPGTAWQVVASGDINGNGTADLILQNQTTGDVALWLTNAAGIVAGAVIGSPGPSYKVVGVGDFNGDGLKDILLQNAAGDIAQWQINGLAISNAAVVGNPGTGWLVKAVGDVNNDGYADIVMRNSANGEIAQWQMNGLVIIAGSNMGGPGTGYDLVGSADYNGDGYSDLLLRSTAGDLAVWLLNGGTITGGAVVGSPGAAYWPITVQ